MSESLKFRIRYRLFLAVILLSCPPYLFSWEKYEHKILADLVLDSVLSFCEVGFTDSLIFLPLENEKTRINKILWNGKSFGNICAQFSEEDIARARCHHKGRTVLQQLEPLKSHIIDEAWQKVKNRPHDLRMLEDRDQNVLYNYLMYHIMALLFAERSSSNLDAATSNFSYSLIYEAVAQSYLADAFSSGHILLQIHDFLSPLNCMNIQIAHDFYSSEGVYVINANGDCWRSFGDKLMHWYIPSFNRVSEACILSLRELFLVYYASNKIELPGRLAAWARSIDPNPQATTLVQKWLITDDGYRYYSLKRMPALLCVPVPVAATWSVRSDFVDMYGIHKRIHYPQLTEEKHHDPDLNEIDTDFLYSRNAVPAWMVPKFLPNDSLENLVRFSPDIASVRYIQDRFLMPPFEGILISAGVIKAFDSAENYFGSGLGIGWGIGDKFFFFRNPSITISAASFTGENQHWLITGDLGIGINTEMFGIFYPRIDFGYGKGFKFPFKKGAGKISLGFDSITAPLGFTYAGLTFRLKYQLLFFDKTLHAPMIEIIVH